MAASILNGDQFQTEEGAFLYVEKLLWPNGPVCPHCGNVDKKRIHRMQGKTTRLGLHKCYECKGQFTVRKGTIFESSHLPLHLWLQIIHLMCASKKGISTNQIQRMLSCSMKTAWFLTHRIREAMGADALWPMGGGGGVVEIDETFIGRKEGPKSTAVSVTKMRFLPLLSATDARAASTSRTSPKSKSSRLSSKTLRARATS